MQQTNLMAWGKNYKDVMVVKNKVSSVVVGENHMVFGSGKQFWGMGSNRFGQLGLKDPQFYQEIVSVFQGHNVVSVHCGAEHTFIINDRKQVFSMGLNIKGQLGLAHFENVYKPTLVAGLLPNGKKNIKAANTALSAPPKSPVVEILEKFDLQVKIDDGNENIFVLQNQEYIVDIACGALFTIALSNKGRVFCAGLIGGGNSPNIDEQIEKTKFKLVQFQSKITKISAGLSGASALTADGAAYIWGRFGKALINLPKRVEREKKIASNISTEDIFYEVKIADECVFALTNKGVLLAFGENIDSQLGSERHKEPFREVFKVVDGAPFIGRLFTGRNSVFAVDVESNQVFGWGSNKYGQIVPQTSVLGLLPITNLGFTIQEHEQIVPSSYFTMFLTSRSQPSIFKSFASSQPPAQQAANHSEYKKLLHDYQLLKALNMALLQKTQMTRKQHKQVQTPSKFQITGITQHRKFNSNIQIAWKELQIQNQISQGGYGIIYKAKWRQITVVVKKFKIQNGEVSLRDFLSECHAMEAVRHPSIVMFLGAVTGHPHYSIILEYCSKGSLWSYLQNRQNNISWEERRRFAIQIAQGVLYLHLCQPPILHRDLKSLNIFLDGNLRIKIGDFGWTKTLEEYMTNKIGTYQWMAPEVIGCKPYTEKADVFSYSIILWEIASREPPYRNINGTKVSQQVLNRELRPPIPPKTPEAWTKLMKRCWQSDPARRPNFREIIRQLEMMRLA